MKAYVLEKNGEAHEAFKLQEVPDPVLKPNQVLVQSECFGVNFADVMARRGLYREAPPLPAVIGYEMVGRIIEVGADVDPELTGKRVVAMCRFGGYAEKVATDQRAVAVIQEDMPLGKAVSLAVNYNTAYYCMHECVTLRKGDKILIHSGAGGVGTALIDLAKNIGCEIYATAGSDEKVAFLKELGVQHPINHRNSDYQRTIAKALKGARLSASFNALGGASFGKDLKLIGSGGSVVLYGGASRAGRGFGLLSSLRFVFQMGFIVPIFLMMRSKSVIGVNMLKLGDFRPHVVQECLQAVINRFDRKEIDPHPGTILPADQLAEAHALLEGRTSIGKIALRW